MNPRFVGMCEYVGGASSAAVHTHDWHVVALPVSQPITVISESSLIVVPSDIAVLMPAGVRHRATSRGIGEVRTVAIPPGSRFHAHERPCLLKTSPLLRELVRHMASLSQPDAQGDYGDSLVDVLAANACEAGIPQIRLRMPTDRRLRTIANALLEDPMDERGLHEWAAVIGASYRTLARHFMEETGLTFQAWRQALLVCEALRRLSQFQSVGSVAAELGYASAAGFTTMFKRVTTLSPSEYCRRVEQVLGQAD